MHSRTHSHCDALLAKADSQARLELERTKCLATSSNNRELMNGERHKAYATTKSSPPTRAERGFAPVVYTPLDVFVREQARESLSASSFRHRLHRHLSFTRLLEGGTVVTGCREIRHLFGFIHVFGFIQLCSGELE